MAMPYHELLERRAALEAKRDQEVTETECQKVEVKLGRPTQRTPENIETIKRALGRGLSIETAAACAGISRRTVYRWMEEDEAFAAQVHEARAHADHEVADELWKAIKDGDIKAITFYLGRRCPEFSPKGADVEVNVNVQNGPRPPEPHELRAGLIKTIELAKQRGLLEGPSETDTTESMDEPPHEPDTLPDS